MFLTKIRQHEVFKDNPNLGGFFISSIFFLIFSISAFVFSISSVTDVAHAESKEWTPPTAVNAIQELHIANSGLTLLRGAEVISVNGTDIVVSMAWGQTNVKFLVQTNGSKIGKRYFGTKFYDGTGKNILVTDIVLGEKILVEGNLTMDNSKMVILADTVRVAK